jgi:K+-transporting ATPase A subunit
VPSEPTKEPSAQRVSAEVAPEGIQEDAVAAQEERAFARRDAERRDHIRQAVSASIVWIIYVFAFLAVAFIIIRAWHWVMPQSFLWLSDEHLRQMDSSLAVAFIASFVARYIQHALPEK